MVSASASIHAEFEAKACDMLTAVQNSLMLNQEAKKEIDFMSTMCLQLQDELKNVRENHTEGITNIRNRAEKCLRKDYLVDQHTTPKMEVIAVPILEPIEEMRTPAIEDLMGNFALENRPNLAGTESKIQPQHRPFWSSITE